MGLDLDRLEQRSHALGWSTERYGSDALLVSTPGGVVISFVNLEDDDALIGLSGGEWHAHPPALFEIGEGEYREFEAEEVLDRVASGELLIAELHRSDGLADRWLHHRRADADLQYLRHGEELRFSTAGETPASR